MKKREKLFKETMAYSVKMCEARQRVIDAAIFWDKSDGDPRELTKAVKALLKLRSK